MYIFSKSIEEYFACRVNFVDYGASLPKNVAIAQRAMPVLPQAARPPIQGELLGERRQDLVEGFDVYFHGLSLVAAYLHGSSAKIPNPPIRAINAAASASPSNSGMFLLLLIRMNICSLFWLMP